MRTIIFLISIQAAVALGAWQDIASEEFSMAPPPKEGSAAYKKDYQLLHELQESRDQEACDLAARMSYPSYKALYSEFLTKREYAKAKDLIERVLKFSIRVSGHFKETYVRPRPYTVDATLKPCAFRPGGSKSYPSGHATGAAASSCILAEMFPKKADEILEYGAYMGDLRVIVGVHHPSDVKAGQKLGQEICERLLSEPDFAEELASH